MEEPITPMGTKELSQERIDAHYERATTKKWIKKISVQALPRFERYSHKELFVKVADVSLDTEMHSKGIKKGTKCRQTLVQFKPTIAKERFHAKTEWVYAFVLNGCVIKMGGTRDGLQGRCGSYLCGHHVQERQKSGRCSITNAFIYNTFVFYLELGYTIEMFAYALPEYSVTIEVLGETRRITAQTYHAYESIFLQDFKKQFGEYPLLSDNCDPKYKTE